MESSVANKVIGIILSRFDADQISSWFENEQIPQILLGLEPGRLATHVQKSPPPASSSFAGGLVAYDKLSTMYAPLDCAEEEGKGATWNFP